MGVILPVPIMVVCMQYMLDICDSYAIDYDVKFNCEKSAALRIGPRHCYICDELTLSGKPLGCVHIDTSSLRVQVRIMI